jgi:hypothetical protein
MKPFGLPHFIRKGKITLISIKEANRRPFNNFYLRKVVLNDNNNKFRSRNSEECAFIAQTWNALRRMHGSSNLNIACYIGFQVLVVVTMKKSIFWDVKQSRRQQSCSCCLYLTYYSVWLTLRSWIWRQKTSETCQLLPNYTASHPRKLCSYNITIYQNWAIRGFYYSLLGWRLFTAINIANDTQTGKPYVEATKVN